MHNEKKIMDRYQKQWENLGTCDPYWAVLSDAAKKGGKWEKGEFFESGRQEIEEVMNNICRIGLQPNRGTALDFGCGVGRLSRALSKHFNRVIGVDISKSMLHEARVQHRDFTNIEFLHNGGNDLGPIASNTIDFVYSNIVLQHMPADRQLFIINEFVRVLCPGGIAIFQTPSRHDLATLKGWVHFLSGNRMLNIARRAMHGKHCVMEIHTLDRKIIQTALDTLGVSTKEIEQNEATGKGFVSYRYYCVKGRSKS